MSEERPPQFDPLPYRDPRDDREPNAVAKAIAAGFAVVVVTWAGTVIGGLAVGSSRGIVCGGIIGIVPFIAYAITLRNRKRRPVVVGGLMIGIAVSVLLIGLCGAVV
jgi:hypothetical protein